MIKIKTIMLMVIAMILILSAYIAGHFGVYFSVVRFLAISQHSAKIFLLSGLAFLGVSFFLATILNHWKDNILNRSYYLLSGAWVGLLVNLLLFFAISWIIVLVCNWIETNYGFKLNIISKEKIIGIFAISLAVVYSIYGIWNAFSPKVNKIDVSINNLPREWVGKKIVQISDVHLGHIYREQYMDGIADKINVLKPDVIVITGDLFDGTDGNLGTFIPSINKLNAPDGIYFVTGNHETYLGIDKSYEVINKTKIVPLRDSLKNINGLQFIGIDYPLRGTNRDISQIVPKMAGYDSKIPSILLIHEPLQIPQAKKLGIDLQLSGHTHKGQLFPFGLITSLIYGKYDDGFQREGSFAIYTSSGLGGWGPPMRTEKRSEIVQITLH